MKSNKLLKQLIDEFPKSKKIISILIRLIKKCYMVIINKTLGVDEKKAVFISFLGKTYSDNPKAISETLYEISPDFKIIWLFNNPEEKKKIVSSYVKCVKTGSIEALNQLATAKFWVDNFPKSIFHYKSRKQVYIQTWHGDRGFKKVLYEVRTLLPNGHYKEGDLIEPKNCNLAVSGSRYGDDVYRAAFGYNGEILKVGTPRNDLLLSVDKERVKYIKQTLNIPENKKILLYAPTFRDSNRNELQDISNIDLIKTLICLEDKMGGEWVCLTRSHAASKGLRDIESDKSIIKNVSNYEDMADLLLISDFLITDYSTSAGDFVLLNRPVILFQYDINDYVKNDRQLHFDMSDSPYIIAETQEELFKRINELTDEMIIKNCKDILEFYGTVETGEASKRVVEYMLSKL